MLGKNSDSAELIQLLQHKRSQLQQLIQKLNSIWAWGALRSRYISCGKRECRSDPHGPYFYLYFRQGSKLRSRYLGRRIPGKIVPGMLRRSWINQLNKISRQIAQLEEKLLNLGGDLTSAEHQRVREPGSSAGD